MRPPSPDGGPQTASATIRNRRIIVSTVAFISTIDARTSSTEWPLSAASSSAASSRPSTDPLLSIAPIARLLVYLDPKPCSLGQRPMICHLRRSTHGLPRVVPRRHHQPATLAQDAPELAQRGRLVRGEQHRVNTHDGVRRSTRQAGRFEFPTQERRSHPEPRSPPSGSGQGGVRDVDADERCSGAPRDPQACAPSTAAKVNERRSVPDPGRQGDLLELRAADEAVWVKAFRVFLAEDVAPDALLYLRSVGRVRPLEDFSPGGVGGRHRATIASRRVLFPVKGAFGYGAVTRLPRPARWARPSRPAPAG